MQINSIAPQTRNAPFRPILALALRKRLEDGRR